MRIPPKAGPAARAKLKLMLPKAIARAIWGAGTKTGTVACHVRICMTNPKPIANVKPSRDQDVMTSCHVSKESNDARENNINWVTISNCLRSIRSANTPAGIARKTIGPEIAIRTAETICGSGSRLVINHPAPTS